MKVIAIGADISKNDVSCSTSLVNNVEKNLFKLTELGASHSALTNVTGDDIVVSAFVEDDLVETINEAIVNILIDCAENLGDLSGISDNEYDAGEGISYAEAAKGMENLTDVSDLIEAKTRKIPGVGYVSSETDDPVVVATVENIESVGVIAGAMMGAALGNKNTYLVERGTTCNVLPGSVIFSATAFMNGNVIDLAVPFQNKTRILR